MKVQVNGLQRSVTYRLNDWRNEKWSETLESLKREDQSLAKMTEWVMRSPTPSPPLHVPGGLTLLGSVKAEALADSRDAQFQPEDGPLNAAGTGMFNEAMRAYLYTPASEPTLTSLSKSFRPSRGSRFVRLQARSVHRTGFCDIYPSTL